MRNERYMFFSNLQQMRRQCDLLLDLDQDMVESILDNGHDWAQDHIAEAKNNLDQVFDFMMNETKKSGMQVSMNIDDVDMIEERNLLEQIIRRVIDERKKRRKRKKTLHFVLVVNERLKPSLKFTHRLTPMDMQYKCVKVLCQV